MDDGDRAKEYDDRWVADCLKEHQRRRGEPCVRPGGPKIKGGRSQGYAPTKCIDCNEPVPAERLAVQSNAIRCIDCQRNFETRRNN